MSPMKTLHATVVRRVLKTLREIFVEGYIVDSQLPMSFSLTTEPEPDVAVVKGEIEDFTDSHPKTAALVIEVSDATLRYDRTKK